MNSNSVNNPAQTVKIMPLGDSITDGYNVPGGYRINLWKKLIDEGFNFEFVGSMKNGPESLPDKNHEGHSGWRIDQINQLIKRWLKKAQPEIILLMIGTNDMVQNYFVETAPQRLDKLVRDIFQQLPEVQILVASIPLVDELVINEKVQNYNSAIKSLVEERKKQGDRLHFVDIYSELSIDDLADGVHPNIQGHSKMADIWGTVLIDVLKESQK
ncbi:MAG: SGNH/GDSL hydrolase family protein [Microcoleaceae cyanobacterium MO_207.B10]|nr:SGNH/GDSL hydrolase family protein [Microcoleaceae cyanobacterium MO_207.B10]